MQSPWLQVFVGGLRRQRPSLDRYRIILRELPSGNDFAAAVAEKLTEANRELWNASRLFGSLFSIKVANPSGELVKKRPDQYAPKVCDRGFGNEVRVQLRGVRHYFFLPEPKFGCQPAPFWLGAAAITLIFCFLGFLASRLLLCSPLAMSTSLDLLVTWELRHSPVTDAVGNAGMLEFVGLRSGDGERKNIPRHRDTKSILHRITTHPWLP